MKIFVYAMREFDEKKFFDRLSEEFGVEYAYTTGYPSLENAEQVKGYDALCVTPCGLNNDIIARFHELGIKYIVTRSIGYDFIDLEFAKSLGMGVGHVQYAPDTVADYAIMLMLMCCRNICHILKRADVQDFSLKGKMGKDIGDCTVGVIGTGRIGQTVLRHLSGFGCRLLAYDLYPSEEAEKYAEYVSLEELYRQADIITLHTPATADNYHMIDKKALNMMKDGVILVNTARGSLIDAEALIEGLENGKVGHAALDVWEQESGMIYVNLMGEPIVNREYALLRSFPNVILAPHTAFYTEKAVSSMAYNAFACIRDMSAGEKNPLVLVYPKTC